jgi:hypothetical protein
MIASRCCPGDPDIEHNRPMNLSAARPGERRATTLTGHLDPGAADFVYLPVRVPAGVSEIAVEYSYDRPAVPAGTLGNACDIGIFDERGVRLGGDGFRGWSGGARSEFRISRSAATPGYLPGPINAGTWHVALGPYTVAPQGLDYSVTVTLTYGEPGEVFQPDPPPLSAKGRGRSWYRGDCHLHTVYSDGRRTPAEVAAEARAAGLDFITSTEHNTPSSHGVWGWHAGDDLLIITGEEVTTRNGHYLALGLPAGYWIDWRYRVGDRKIDQFVEEIHRAGGLFVPAHPYGPCLACSWKFGYTGADAVEVWNGPWTLDDEAVLAAWDALLAESARSGERWLPAMGNSDAHSERDVIGLPQTVVLADGLSRDAILAGIAAGRSWLADSSAVRLSFTASTQPAESSPAADPRADPGDGTAQIGDRLRVPADTLVTARVEVAGVPDGTVRIVSDQGAVYAERLPPGGAGVVTVPMVPRRAAYLRVEVRHDDVTTAAPYGSMAALTNPIFLGQ